MRVLCGITPRHAEGGSPPVLLVIETAAPMMTVMAIAVSPIRAGSCKTVAYPLDTEHLFGFTERADIGSEGGKEFVIDPTLRDGRSTGSFANTAHPSHATADFQISHEATAPPGTLDLTNFERHQATLRFGLEF